MRVDPDADRPVTITVSGHTHRYEFAWRATPTGPIITDLRVTSDDGTPITSDTLRKINTGRLAASAARADTPAAATLGADLRRHTQAAITGLGGDDDPAAVVAAACEWLESLHDPAATEAARELRALDPEAAVAAAPGDVEAFRFSHTTLPTPPGRTVKAGRPRLTHTRLLEVAEWARTARAHGENVYQYIAVAAARADDLDHPYSDESAKKWVKRAKAAGLLGPDELGRRPRNHHQEGR